MKNIIVSGLLAFVIFTFTGCAHFDKKGETAHVVKKYAAALPPGWSVTYPVGTLDLPATETASSVTFTAPGSNAPSFWAPRPRIFLASKEAWIDYSRGGGTFLFTDPNASQVASGVVNQGALGGTHNFTVGNISSTITTNAVNAITAGGTAVGNVVGAALSKAAGK